MSSPTPHLPTVPRLLLAVLLAPIACTADVAAPASGPDAGPSSFPPPQVDTADGAAPAPPPPVYVSLTFDDGWADQWHAVHDILGGAGLQATLFVNSGYVGRPGRLDWDQLRALAAAGHEIGGHTAGHRDVAALSPTESRAQICNDRVKLAHEGLTPRSFAFPYGHHDDDGVDAVRACGYASARLTTGLGCGPDCATAESLPPADRYRVRAHPSIDGHALDVVTGWIEAARADGGWVPLTFHRIGVDGPCEGDYCWDADTLAQLVAWLSRPEQASQVRVVPVSALIAAAASDATPAPLVTNGSMDRTDRHGATDCIQRLSNTADDDTRYLRVVDHEGAREVIETTIYRRPHSLLIARDSGACAPFVYAGERYQVGLSYRTSAALDDVELVVYGRSAATGSWRELLREPVGTGPGDGEWHRHERVLDPVAPDISNLSFGARLGGAGRLEIDDLAAARRP